LSIEYRWGHSRHRENATLHIMGHRWDAQESTCMWKPPNIEGRRGRCWELKGERKERKKIPGGRSAHTDRKQHLGSLTGMGRAGKQERGGGLTTHTEKARLWVGVMQERDSMGRGTSCVTWDDGKKEYHMLHGMTGKKEY